MSLSTAYEAALQSSAFQLFPGGAGGASAVSSPDHDDGGPTCHVSGHACTAHTTCHVSGHACTAHSRAPLARRLDEGNGNVGSRCQPTAGAAKGAVTATALRQTTRVLAKIKRWNADLDNVGLFREGPAVSGCRLECMHTCMGVMLSRCSSAPPDRPHVHACAVRRTIMVDIDNAIDGGLGAACDGCCR